MPNRKKAAPKGKIIDALPKNLKGSLDKARIKDITFADLRTITKVLDDFHDADPAEWMARACQTCIKYH